MTSTNPETIRQAVEAKYAGIARRVSEEAGSGCGGTASTAATCCGTSTASCGGAGTDPVTSGLYAAVEQAALPEAAVLTSLGCGNPTALAQLEPGEIVLDLGSGGGIDVLLAAKRVGPTGFAYGLDMTDEMLALARRNQAEAGVTNVEFLKGHIEAIPLPDNTVDVVISNCVINLSADKDAVLREAFRVLKPGGRFAVSDVVALKAVPPRFREVMEAWVGCLAGALEAREYRQKLEAAGFTDVGVEVTRHYRLADFADDTAGVARLREVLTADELAEADGALVSAFVRARKPQA